MASSSSGTTLPNIKYDVFLSYCFQDTGTNFTSHLVYAFKREGINAFIDDRQDEGEPPKRKHRLDKGEEISKTLLNKISESLVSVLIFSENYGGSSRCLNELVEISRCMEEYERDVLPVFRGVKPSHVRHQNGAFGEAFEKMLTGNQQLKEKEEKWRSALVEAAARSGWDSHNTLSEAEMVNKVVERIKVIVNKLPLEDSYDGFVGIARVEKVESLLQLELTKNVQFVGIWGTGGIGKTTIANMVYSRIKNQFDGACFLTNVGDRLERGKLKSIRKDMLEQLLESHDFRGSFAFPTMSVRNIQRKKFLIILDDVTNSPKLKDLVKSHNFYGLGSRIILTSRDKQALKICGCKTEHIYEVPKLNRSEALRLFESCAFKQPCKEKFEYKELSEKVINYANGLPLALEVLGCNLYGKKVKEWQSKLNKLEEKPDKIINDILMISYAELDPMQKSIFLDIACVFEGWRIDEVKRILNACHFYPTSNIGNLHDKALITISHELLGMHDLVRRMGQNIVIQESEENPGRLSRIWRYKDFCEAMTQNKVTEKVEVISVDISQATNMVLTPEIFEEMSRLRVLNLYDSDMELMPETFEKMSRLKVLNLYHFLPKLAYCLFPWHHSKGIKIHLPNGLRFKSDKLAYLRWDSYPLKSLPNKIDLRHLVELQLVRSSIVHLRSGGVEPDFPNLEVMNLSNSKDLSNLPDLSRYPNLERLGLEGCYKLREIPSSVQCLSKLEYLNLKSCWNLTRLPELPPKIMGLGLSDTGLEQLPSSIGNLFLLTLDISYCKKLRSLPESIGELRSLLFLFVKGCSNLTSLPENLGKVQSLQRLSIRGTAIRSLPSSWCHLSKKAINLQGLGLVSLEIMDLSNSDLESLPASIKQLPHLQWLCLDGCKFLTSVPDLPSSLSDLHARRCTSLRSLGSLFGGDPSDRRYLELDLTNSINLDEDSRIRSVTAARSRINAIAACTRTEFSLSLPSHMRARATLCIPGGRVPEWVEYREEGSSVKLKLLGYCTLEDLSQLIFCAVVASSNGAMRCFEASCKCLFVTDEFGPFQVEAYDDHRKKCSRKDREAGFQSEHVVFWYRNMREVLGYDTADMRQYCDTIRCSEVTFEFQFTFIRHSKHGYHKTDGTILRCGVSPIGRSFETKRGKRFHAIKV